LGAVLAPALSLLSLAAAEPPAFPWPEPDTVVHDERGADRAARLVAAERLAREGGPENTIQLRPLLEDLDPSVRLTAARALARRQDEAALTAAAGWLLSGSIVDRGSGFEVMRVATTLSERARLALERALADTDPAVRLMALDVLADKDARPSLAAVAGALDDSAAAVRLVALRLLADARDSRAALAVLRRIGDADRQVRREAISALGALGDLRVVPPLLRLIEAPQDDLRRAAIEALAGLHAAAAAPALAAQARRRPADPMARQAQWALGEIGTPEAISVLVALLREPPVTDETRRALLGAGSRALPPLVRELEEGEAAAEAAPLLARLGDRRAVGPLLSALQRRDGSLPAVLRALAALAPAEGARALVPLAADPSREIRRLALEALLAIGDDRAVAVLPAALADPDALIRRRALALASRLHARVEIPRLIPLAADEDADVRREAVRALGELGGAEACRALASLASREERRTEGPRTSAVERRGLAEALSAASTPACVPALLAVLPATRGPARWPLLAGLAASWRDESSRAAGALSALGEALRGDEPAATVAADALVWAPSARAQSILRDRFGDAVDPVRARLCPALAMTPPGRVQLAAVLDNPSEDEEVRAAAAWALAGAPEPAVRGALERARDGLHPAVSANARAALAAVRPPGPGRRLSLRVLVVARPEAVLAPAVARPGGASDERPLAHGWLRAALPGRLPVWGRTDSAGQLQLLLGDASSGAAGPRVTFADPQLVLEDPGDGLGQISGHEVSHSQPGRRLPGGQAVDMHSDPRGVDGSQTLTAQRGDQAGEDVAAASGPERGVRGRVDVRGAVWLGDDGARSLEHDHRTGRRRQPPRVSRPIPLDLGD
jgi:HEAT repeat protein